MQEMVSRYRNRLTNSSSKIQALSASREKSNTQTLSNNTNILPPSIIKKRQQSQFNFKPQPHQKSQSRLKQKFQTPANPYLNQTPQIKSSLLSNHSLPPQPSTCSKPKLPSSRTNILLSNDKEKQPPNHNSLSKGKSKKPSKTPNKKPAPITFQSLNDSYSQSILQVVINDLKQKNSLIISALALICKEQVNHKIKMLLQQYFAKRLQITQRINSPHLIQTNRQMTQSHLIAVNSNISALQPELLSTHTLPQQNKAFVSQLQKRFFESQKSRQYLQSKLQSHTKKLQLYSKQLQRAAKLQKLISNTIQSQNQSRRQVIRLRKQLEVSQLKNIQQQKIWKKEVNSINIVVEQLRNLFQQKFNQDQLSQKIQNPTFMVSKNIHQ